jgi:alanine racemase
MDNRSCEQSDRDGASGHLTIDLGALRQNYLFLVARLGPAKAASVVKADAYGLGVDRVAPVLYDAGCRDFFVAHFAEALALNPCIGSDARIFVLNGLQPGNEIQCADRGFIPVLNSLEQVANWASAARELGRHLPAALQFDTGMSRLGLSPDEAHLLSTNRALLGGIDLLFIMSHLASADEQDNDQNSMQLVAFREVGDLFKGIDLCFANSSAIFLGGDYHCVMARPGIALYGGSPVTGAPNPMKQVVRLDARVIQTRTIPAGTRIGYGGVHLTSDEMRLATIAAGYADGLPRGLSDRGAAYFGNQRLPIVGRVSMDSIVLDVTALAPGSLKIGSAVEMIGPNQTLEKIAADAGTISYEILTNLGKRYRRTYLN